MPSPWLRLCIHKNQAVIAVFNEIQAWVVSLYSCHHGRSTFLVWGDWIWMFFLVSSRFQKQQPAEQIQTSGISLSISGPLVCSWSWRGWPTEQSSAQCVATCFEDASENWWAKGAQRNEAMNHLLAIGLDYRAMLVFCEFPQPHVRRYVWWRLPSCFQ